MDPSGAGVAVRLSGRDLALERVGPGDATREALTPQRAQLHLRCDQRSLCADPSRFSCRCTVQACSVVDETPEKKGDLFTMSVFISRRQRGAEMHQHLIKRGTRTQRLVGLDRRRNRLLRVLQEFSKSDNRLSRR